MGTRKMKISVWKMGCYTESSDGWIALKIFIAYNMGVYLRGICLLNTVLTFKMAEGLKGNSTIPWYIMMNSTA